MMSVLLSLSVTFSSLQGVPTLQKQINNELTPVWEDGLRSDNKNNLPVIHRLWNLLIKQLRSDNKNNLPVLIGPVTAEMIIEHRSEFSDIYEKVQIDPELIKRWKAIETPCAIVAVFGSWCGDSHHWLPDVIKLAETSNPFISINWIGTNRSKATKKSAWPQQSIPQKVKKVPTFWLFASIPGGKIKLVGSIVENPPKPNQTMAEALIELLERL